MKNESASHMPAPGATFQVTETNITVEQDIETCLDQQRLRSRPCESTLPRGSLKSQPCLPGCFPMAAARCGTSLRSPESCLVSFSTADGGVLLRPELSHLQGKLLLYPLPIAREALSAFLMQGTGNSQLCLNVTLLAGSVHIVQQNNVAWRGKQRERERRREVGAEGGKGRTRRETGDG